jgi:hypothetical protein
MKIGNPPLSPFKKGGCERKDFRKGGIETVKEE